MGGVLLCSVDPAGRTHGGRPAPRLEGPGVPGRLADRRSLRPDVAAPPGGVVRRMQSLQGNGIEVGIPEMGEAVGKGHPLGLGQQVQGGSRVVAGSSQIVSRQDIEHLGHGGAAGVGGNQCDPPAAVIHPQGVAQPHPIVGQVLRRQQAAMLGQEAGDDPTDLSPVEAVGALLGNPSQGPGQVFLDQPLLFPDVVGVGRLERGPVGVKKGGHGVREGLQPSQPGRAVGEDVPVHREPVLGQANGGRHDLAQRQSPHGFQQLGIGGDCPRHGYGTVPRFCGLIPGGAPAVDASALEARIHQLEKVLAGGPGKDAGSIQRERSTTGGVLGHHAGDSSHSAHEGFHHSHGKCCRHGGVGGVAAALEDLHPGFGGQRVHGGHQAVGNRHLALVDE